jgi:hypothetical protein
MKRSVVQNALLLLTVGILIPALSARAAETERVAVIRIKAVDGLAVEGAPVQSTRDQAFLVGSSYRVAKSAVASLDGVSALVLVDRRSDSMSGASVVQAHKDEVIAVRGDVFTVKGVDGKDVTYAIDRLSDGSIDLLGPGDRIIARGDKQFKVWKVEGASLVSKDRITLY